MALTERPMADILIIDDELQMRRLLARLLRDAGHTVHEAANGREGLKLFREVHPVLIITDILMPDTEGIETIRELRRAAPTLPILAISGSNTPVYLDAATKLGATASLRKPFSAEELLGAVETLLGGSAE
jgi:CheY-like chemotaxis protein